MIESAGLVYLAHANIGIAWQPYSKGPCPLSQFVPRPSFRTGVGRSQPSVGWKGTNRVRWPVSKQPRLFCFVGTGLKAGMGRGGLLHQLA